MHRMLSKWEYNRVKREKLEKQFKNYSGYFDVVEMHLPYTYFNFLEEMMESAYKRREPKILVINGDSINLDVFSVFYKRSSDISTPDKEIDMLIKVLKVAQTVYDKIIFIPTNHEARLEKVISRNMPERVITEQLLKRMRTLEDEFIENKLNKLICTNTPMIQIGDVLCCHMESNSGKPGNLSSSLIQYLMPRVKDWSVAYQSHSHTQSKISVDCKTIIETGCLADSLDYWISNWKMFGKGKFSTIGYAYGSMDNGKALLNKCDYHICKWQGRI